MAEDGYNPGAAEDPQTNPEYQHQSPVVETPAPDEESETTAHVG